MSRWCEVLPSRGVIRTERVWCPSCYRQWRAEGRPLFDPLLWSIQPVEICLHHKRALANHCPHCGQIQPFLASHYRVGYCSRCMKCLGSGLDNSASVNGLYNKGEIEWQQWLSTDIGKLLAVPLGCSFPNKERVGRTLTAFSRNAPQQSMPEFAKWLGMPLNYINAWCSGYSLPRLSSLLYVCYNLGITLVEFLLKEDIVKELDKNPSRTSLKYKKRKTCRRDKESIRRNLEDVLASEEVPPPSLLTVSKQLGIHSKYLRQIFPELCKRISGKYKQHQSAYRLLRLRSICEDVKRISLELHDRGIEPTRRRISMRMNKSGYFRKKEVQQTLMNIRQELGYDAC
jgi:hypothetical protein